MKRQTRKLNLGKTTIRLLQEPAIREVRGGVRSWQLDCSGSCDTCLARICYPM